MRECLGTIARRSVLCKMQKIEYNWDMKYLNDIKKHPLFINIGDEEIPAVMTCLGGYTRSYEKNEIIFLSNEPVKSVGIILKGRVKMVKEYENGDVATLLNLCEGEIFGETFACGSVTNSKVTFETASQADILFLPFHRVMHTCDMTCGFHHRLIENMVKMISDKNVQLMEKMEITSRKNLRDKIMTYLLIQAEKQDSHRFNVPLGRIELAEYLCADRSALTRELSNMQADGLIKYNKNEFEILQEDEYEKI